MIAHNPVKQHSLNSSFIISFVCLGFHLHFNTEIQGIRALRKYGVHN
jgi:hypothetical protein